MAALLTRMSSVPKRSTVCANICSTLSTDDTSHCTPRHCLPVASTSFAASASVSGLMSQMTMLAPSRAIASAMALPSPCPPPVISATLSWSCMLTSPSLAPAGACQPAGAPRYATTRHPPSSLQHEPRIDRVVGRGGGQAPIGLVGEEALLARRAVRGQAEVEQRLFN